jgi:hypothetical protein
VRAVIASFICLSLTCVDAFNARTDRIGPKTGSYFGVAPSWPQFNFQLAPMVKDIGIEAASYVVFTRFPLDNDAIWALNTTLTQIAAQKTIAIVTPEPVFGLESVTVANVTAYVNVLRKYESMGATIIVRFAHEMNGSWYPWGQTPAAFKAAFQRFSKILRAKTKYATMLWAPNIGPGYPYSGGAYGVNCTSHPMDCSDLDTNQDGIVNGLDDMFSPYWPGTDVVDWVGSSLYWWGAEYPWGQNEIAPVTNFADVLLGVTLTSLGNGTTAPIPNFYAEYSVAYNKPMIIAETSGLYNLCDKNKNTAGCNATSPQTTDYQVKKSWFDQTYKLKGPNSIPATFPNIKIISWFNWVKVESEAQGNTVDWSISRDKTINAAFKQKLNEKYYNNGAMRKYWMTAADFRKNVWNTVPKKPSKMSVAASAAPI